MYPKKIAENTATGYCVYVYGEGKNPMALISKGVPSPDAEAHKKPLQALVAHLDLSEWVMVKE